MTSIEARLASLERTVKFQRCGMVTAFLVAVVVWSAGAMSKTPLESLKAKELLIESEDGKTIAKLGGDGKGGAMLSLSTESGSGDRSLQFAVNDKSSSITAAFDGSTIQVNAGEKSTISISHKDENGARVQITSDPKSWPVMMLREKDGSIRWQSPKRGA